MKRTLFLLLVLALTACSNANVPQLTLEFPEIINANPSEKEYLTSICTQVNSFAIQCDKMTRKAEKYKGKVFDELSGKQQEAMVKLDLDYASAWFDINTMLYKASMKTAKASTSDVQNIQIITAIDASMREVNAFIDKLSSQYGQDLKLDKTSPFYVETPDRIKTPQVESSADSTITEQ